MARRLEQREQQLNDSMACGWYNVLGQLNDPVNDLMSLDQTSMQKRKSKDRG